MTDEVERDGRVKDKLIATKEAWARDGRGLTGHAGDPGGGRLPPGQHEVRTWPVLDLGITPRLDTAAWSLTVDGRVGNPLRWSWDDLQAQPGFEHVSDIHCVTTWSRYDNHWRGVSARHLLALVRPLADARHIVFHAFDGYTTNLPISAFDDDDVLLATHWEGEPITLEHGGPVRVIVPKRYFWKSAKWVKRIQFVGRDRPGYWEVRGYHNDAHPWAEERYGSPPDGAPPDGVPDGDGPDDAGDR